MGIGEKDSRGQGNDELNIVLWCRRNRMAQSCYKYLGLMCLFLEDGSGKCVRSLNCGIDWETMHMLHTDCMRFYNQVLAW